MPHENRELDYMVAMNRRKEVTALVYTGIGILCAAIIAVMPSSAHSQPEPTQPVLAATQPAPDQPGEGMASGDVPQHDHAEISVLDSALATIKEKISAIAAELSSEAELNQAQESRLNSLEQKVSALSSPAPASPKVAAKKKPKKPSAKRKSTTPQPEEYDYSVRGLSDGLALIQDKNTAVISKYSVGDSVAGYGVITLIDPEAKVIIAGNRTIR